jgi:hypothetical protein
MLTADVAVALNRTLRSVYARAKNLRLQKSEAFRASGASGRLKPGDKRIGHWSQFKKGVAPHNKGCAHRPGWAPGRMKDGQFKPGERRGKAAENWRPVGTILTDGEGYQRIKVRDAKSGEAYGFGNVRVWPLLQRHVWEQAHGPIPAGHSICFKNGDKTDVRLENLECVSRRDLMARNTLHRLPKELARTVQLLGALNRQIRKRTKHGEEQNQRPA